MAAYSRYAGLALPVALPDLYTYGVPDSLSDDIFLGARVMVQFGKSKVLTGVVMHLTDQEPPIARLKPVLQVLDDQPLLFPAQLDFYRWMSEYYMCHLGEVVAAALPAGLKLHSESHLSLGEDPSGHLLLSEEEERLLRQVRSLPAASYKAVSKDWDRQHLSRTVDSLVRKGLLSLSEQAVDPYKPKVEKRYRLTESYLTAAAIEAFVNQHEKRAPKQVDVLLAYLSRVPLSQLAERNPEGLSRQELLGESGSASALEGLVAKGLLEKFDRQVSRLPDFPAAVAKPAEGLRPFQQEALAAIGQQWQSKSTVLLHGITGSGKTELYIQLIQEALADGGQVLYLLPEIALTVQIVQRLRGVFGTTMAVYHSRFSDNERVEIWRGVAQGEHPLVVGVRSAIFLPFQQLDLVVVDEEHDQSYKQHDPAPRYQGRDAALALAHQLGAKTVLGTATPAVESYFNALDGKYGLVTMNERYGSGGLPAYQVVDILKARKQNQMRGEISLHLLQAMEDTLAAGRQIILFQNQRGYAPFLQCGNCGHIPYCPNCDISLTFHLHGQEVRCHYCGYREPLPEACDACGRHEMKTRGAGTQKLEEDVQALLPQAKVARLDQDSTSHRDAFDQLFRSFQAGQTDVLVGTQMLSKGLDFERVGLVGIIHADQAMHQPDFRSHERAFQLLTQVAGRSGRGADRGLVVVQTWEVDHPLLGTVRKGDFGDWYRTEVSEREDFGYPPFRRLVRVHIKSRNRDRAWQAARLLMLDLQRALPEEDLLGPEMPPVARLRNEYLLAILIKFDRRNERLKSKKQALRRVMWQVSKAKALSGVRIYADVDPH